MKSLIILRTLMFAGPIVVRTEEVLIVVFVLILWACAIALFFNRWGKIRMLEPYQPKFHEEEHRPSCPLVELTNPVVGQVCKWLLNITIFYRDYSHCEQLIYFYIQKNGLNHTCTLIVHRKNEIICENNYEYFYTRVSFLKIFNKNILKIFSNTSSIPSVFDDKHTILAYWLFFFFLTPLQ